MFPQIGGNGNNRYFGGGTAGVAKPGPFAAYSQPGPQMTGPNREYADFGMRAPSAYPAGGNASQMGKDQAAFGAAGQHGVANAQALGSIGSAMANAAGQAAVANSNMWGQYGVGQQQALVNSQIAHANALGQMGNNYYNMMGQMAQFGAGLGAAGASAMADTNKAGLVSGALGGLGGGAFGGGGFNFSGPGGFSGSGQWGGGRSGGGVGSGGSFQPSNPMSSINAGFGFMDRLRGDVSSRQSDANQIRGDINGSFGATQRNLMDQRMSQNLMRQTGMSYDAVSNPALQGAVLENARLGYGALDGLYDKSDYGMNTGAAGISQNSSRRRRGF